MSRNVITVLCVIAAAVIAWILVDFALHFVYFVFRLVLVAIVAIVVYFVLRFLLRRTPE
jgi:putative flippase GtrA